MRRPGIGRGAELGGQRGAAHLHGHEAEDGEQGEESKGGKESRIHGEDGGRQHHEERQYREINVVAVALDVEELDAHSEERQMDGRSDEVAAGDEKEIDEKEQEVDDSQPRSDAARNDEGAVGAGEE